MIGKEKSREKVVLIKVGSNDGNDATPFKTTNIRLSLLYKESFVSLLNFSFHHGMITSSFKEFVLKVRPSFMTNSKIVLLIKYKQPTHVAAHRKTYVRVAVFLI